MAVTNLTVRITGNGGAVYEWDGTPPFTLYLGGELIHPYYPNNVITVSGPDLYEPPVLYIRESSDVENPLPPETHPRRAVVQWRGVIDAQGYRVYHYTGGDWEHRQWIRQFQQGYYEFESEPLSDGEEKSHRVVSVDDNDNESEPIETTHTMICHPDAPSIDISYDGSKFTVAAR